MLRLNSNEENLIEAAEDGDYANVLDCINKGANLNCKNDLGMTALHYAAKEGHEKIVKLLLDMGAKIDEKNDKGWTALHFGALWGEEDVMRLLLENGANINDQNGDGDTALHLAARDGNETALKYLLEKNPRVYVKNVHKNTVLHLAAETGKENIVKYLLVKVTNVDDKNNNGWTALHCAAANGNADVVNLLLANGAKADERNNNGETPLDLAHSYGKSAVEKILEIASLKPSKPLQSQDSGIAAKPISHINKAIADALTEIARKLVVPSIKLLKQSIIPENVVDVAALLAGHNMVLIALRGGLLKKPYSSLDGDQDWFKDNLYCPICDKVKCKEEQDTVMKIVNHAESLGIIHNSEEIRQRIVIKENVEGKIQTIGSVIVDLYQCINKVDAGFRDVARHTKSVSLALKQFHQAYQTKQKIDCISSLLRLVISAVPFTATAIEKPVGMGFELLLTGMRERMNQSTDKFTDVDLTDLRIAQWFVSESYQRYLPEHVRELFANEAQQTFGGMLELEECIFEMMKDSNVTPLIIARRSTTTASVLPQTRSVFKSAAKHEELGLKGKAQTPAGNEAKRRTLSNIPDPTSVVIEWTAQYNKYLKAFGVPDLTLGGAVLLASQLSGKDEPECESILHQLEDPNTGRFDKTQFVSAMNKLING